MLRSVDDARARALTAYNRNLRGWVFDEPVALSIPLGTPTKKQTNENPAEVLSWREQWTGYAGPGELRWATKRLGNYGSTDIPTHLVLTSREQVASLVRKSQELARILAVKQQLAAIPKDALLSTFGHWRGYTQAEAELLVEVVRWINGHDLSSYYVRELPIRGVHSKWVENHRAVLQAACGNLNFRQPEALCEYRFPGFHGALPFERIAVPAECTAVLVIENRTTFLALPDIPGLMLVNGQGFGALRITAARGFAGKSIYYWGDLDVHGFEILDGFRCGLPETQSVLMDLKTVRAYEDMAVPDRVDQFSYASLTEDERETVSYLRERGLRIEQERILLDYAVEAIKEAMRASD